MLSYSIIAQTDTHLAQTVRMDHQHLQQLDQWNKLQTQSTRKKIRLEYRPFDSTELDILLKLNNMRALNCTVQ